MKLHTHRAKLIEIILLALLGAVMYVSQVIMAVLPNIEIVSLLIIIITRKFGVKALSSIYVFVFCEVITYGIHIWVINYLYVWAVLWLAVFIIRKIDSVVVYALLSAVFGLLFGTLCSVPYFIMGGVAMGIANIISGIAYDLIHCGANFVIAIILYKPFMRIANKAIKPL